MTANDHDRNGPETGAHASAHGDRDALEWEDDGPDDDLPPTPGGPVRSSDDALTVLLGLVGPERAGPAALWFLLLDASGYVLPVVLPITDVPPRADPEVVRRLLEVLGSVLARDGPGGSVLVGLVRAAGGDRGLFEESWVRALRAGAAASAVRVWGFAAIGESRARMLER